MSWKQAVVQVSVGSRRGSGVFVGDHWVLTAGHVIKAESSVEPSPNAISVAYGENSWTVSDYAIHPDFLTRGSRRADMALLHTREVGEQGLATSLSWDPDPEEQVALNGYPDDLQYEYQVGHTRREGPLQRYLLISHDLRVVDGLSGAPLLIGDDVAPSVVGIAVWAGSSEAISIPLLESTLGVLRRQLT